jgi:MFS family permease
MQFIFAPLWGRVSDRIGRRPILLLGLASSVVFYTLFGIASELGARTPGLGLGLLFVARIGAGIAGATISTAQAVIADSTQPEGRARGMALIGAAFGIGFTFGPLVGFASLFLPDPGAPGFMAATLSLLAFLLATSMLPETLRTETTGLRRRLIDWRGVREVLGTPSVGMLVATFFFTTMAFSALESTLSLLNQYLLNPGVQDQTAFLSEGSALTTERKNFLVFSYIGLVLVITQGFLYRRLVQRVGELRFLRLGLVLMIVGLAASVAVGLAAEPRHGVSREVIWPAALAVMTLAVIGFALLTPSVQSLVSRRSDPARQGEVLGVNQSSAALARILGPLFGLPLFMRTTSHVLPYGLAAALLVIVFLYSLRLAPD